LIVDVLFYGELLLSGGYALSLATDLKNIQAVMVQVPYVDGAETAKLYPLQRYPEALKRSSQDYMGSRWA
jgi:hypothetical protein